MYFNDMFLGASMYVEAAMAQAQQQPQQQAHAHPSDCQECQSHQAGHITHPPHPAVQRLLQEPNPVQHHNGTHPYPVHSEVIHQRHNGTAPLTVHSEDIHGPFMPNWQRDHEALQAAGYLQQARNNLLTAHPGNAMNPYWPECQQSIDTHGPLSMNELVGLCIKRNTTARLLADLEGALNSPTGQNNTPVTEASAAHDTSRPPDRSESEAPLGLASHLSAHDMQVNRGTSLPAMENFSFQTSDTTNPPTPAGIPDSLIDPALLAIDAQNAQQGLNPRARVSDSLIDPALLAIDAQNAQQGLNPRARVWEVQSVPPRSTTLADSGLTPSNIEWWLEQAHTTQ